MFRKCLWLVAVAVLVLSQWVAGPAIAAELDEATRTVPLNAEGDTIVLSLDQVARGRKKFNNSCAICHNSGITKTNPTVGLDAESLAGALPPRDNIEALVAYFKEPMTYDGLSDISSLHPSMKSSDIYPLMRGLTDEDLVSLAGHILIQPKIMGPLWGGGKSKVSAPGLGNA
ncbi:MAG: cytochrome c-550 [Leptolyngbya sp. RL_3_1]|nr:cytochrome c-550 [Leptolyngbya sp. RL_3_1]